MSPKILLEKNKERENRVSEEKERRKKKKGMTTLLFFFFFKFSLRGEPYFGCNVIQNPALIYVFLTLVPKRNLI